jgi:hypothetical protein
MIKKNRTDFFRIAELWPELEELSNDSWTLAWSK